MSLQNVDAIVCLGGDGTMSEIVQVLKKICCKVPLQGTTFEGAFDMEWTAGALCQDRLGNVCSYPNLHDPRRCRIQPIFGSYLLLLCCPAKRSLRSLTRNASSSGTGNGMAASTGLWDATTAVHALCKVLQLSKHQSSAGWDGSGGTTSLLDMERCGFVDR